MGCLDPGFLLLSGSFRGVSVIHPSPGLMQLQLSVFAGNSSWQSHKPGSACPSVLPSVHRHQPQEGQPSLGLPCEEG